MKRIPLTKGKYATVDDRDFKMLSKYSWQAKSSPNTNIYTPRTDIDGRKISMAKMILKKF